ncbi:hypothetical protein BDN70DRAFT_992877 [Pholiota conissans]|uniref:Uncharacterized protein n=1 Tax=Pholiota conissans TaxID=109636 RepID=A0A9P6CU94_9AGAR|nr:hypothetical protein BDN70DRAFT_992877 [Pholiota conissans]
MLALQPSLHTHTSNNNVGLVVAFMAGSLGSAIVSPALNGFFAGYSITDKGHSIPTSSVFASSRKASKVIVLKDVKPHKLGLVSSLSVTVLSSSANNGGDVRLGESLQGGSSSSSSSSGSGGGGHSAGSGHGNIQGGNDDSTPPNGPPRVSSNVFGIRKVYNTRRLGTSPRKGSGGGGPPSPPGGARSMPGSHDDSKGNDGSFFLLVLALVLAIVVSWVTAARYSQSPKARRTRRKKKKRDASLQTQVYSDSAHGHSSYFPIDYDSEDDVATCTDVAVPLFASSFDYWVMAQQQPKWNDSDADWGVDRASLLGEYCDALPDDAELLFRSWDETCWVSSGAVVPRVARTQQSLDWERAFGAKMWREMWPSSEVDSAVDPQVIMDICNGVYCDKVFTTTDSEEDEYEYFVEEDGFIFSLVKSLQIGRRLRSMVLPFLCMVAMALLTVIGSLLWVVRNVDHVDIDFDGQSLNDPVGHLEEGVYADRAVGYFADENEEEEVSTYLLDCIDRDAKVLEVPSIEIEIEVAHTLDFLERTTMELKIRNGTV